MKHRLTRISGCAALLASVVLVACPRNALACSGSSCLEESVPMPDGARVPANVPGIPFRPGWSTVVEDGADAGSPLPVLRKDGALVPTHAIPNVRPGSVGSHSPFSQLLVPDAPLEPGAYTLEHQARCSPGTVLSQALEVVTAATLPTALGTLRAQPEQDGLVRVVAGSVCTKLVYSARSRLVVEHSSDAAAFATVGVLEVMVDGHPWRGAVADSYAVEQVIGPPREFDPMLVYAACPGTDGGGLAPGPHVAEVRMVIEGAATQPAPASTSFTLECAPEGPSLDGGAGASPGSVATGDESGGGCAIGGGPLRATGWLAPLAVVLGLLRRRR